MTDNTKYTPELAFKYVIDAIKSNNDAFEYIMSNGEYVHKFDGYHINTKYVSHTYYITLPFKNDPCYVNKASFYKKDMLSTKSIFDGPSIKLSKYATESIVDESILKHAVWYTIFGLKIKKLIITERIQNPEFRYRLNIGPIEFFIDECMYNEILETYKNTSIFNNVQKNESYNTATTALDSFLNKQKQN